MTDKPTLGPLGRTRFNKSAGVWTIELNAEGQKEFDRRLAEFPDPTALLLKAFPKVARWAFIQLRKHPGALKQAATLGLWKGLANWDPKRGAQNTCIARWICSEVQGEVRRSQRWIDRVSMSPDQLGRDGMGWRLVEEALVERLTPTDVVADRDENRHLAARLDEAKKSLKDMELRLIELQFGKDGQYGLEIPWSHLGKQLGFSCERARQVRDSAFGKMRVALEDYCD